ncbi:hypothetical protein Tco_0144927 [Tanacetum coccineum]
MCCEPEGSVTRRGGSFNYKGVVYGLTKAMKEAIWLRRLLEELGVELNTWQLIEAKTVDVLKVGTEHNADNALAKVVARSKFTLLRVVEYRNRLMYKV